MAIKGAYTAWRYYWDNPAVESTQTAFESRQGYYRAMWRYYANTIYDSVDMLATGLVKAGLYKQTRAIYNPTRRLVDFYAGAVYSGALSLDGNILPPDIQDAFPFNADNRFLRAAISQFWVWSNWLNNKTVMVRYGAAAGDVLIEVIDDLDREKVYANVVWPGLVADLKLDQAGNVKSYALEYDTKDDKGQRYVYRKEVDGESIRIYRDQTVQSEIPNEYGFVPAVWVNHTDLGGLYGAPAIWGSVRKVDELNSLASHAHDQIHKKINSPLLFTLPKGGRLENVFGKKKDASTQNDIDEPDESDRQKLLYIQAPEGTQVHPLSSDMSISDVMPAMEQLIGEIEHDHPELSMYNELRSMSAVTGPAANRLLGDVRQRVQEAANNYDQQCVKLFQMGVAIAGYRQNRTWSRNTRQQAVFAPFDLRSYERGDLDMSVLPRDLVHRTPLEEAQEQLALFEAIKAGVDAGLPLDMVVKKIGVDQDFVDTLLANPEYKARLQMAQLGLDVGPMQPQAQPQPQQGQTPPAQGQAQGQ